MKCVLITVIVLVADICLMLSVMYQYTVEAETEDISLKEVAVNSSEALIMEDYEEVICNRSLSIQYQIKKKRCRLAEIRLYYAHNIPQRCFLRFTCNKSPSLISIYLQKAVAVLVIVMMCFGSYLLYSTFKNYKNDSSKIIVEPNSITDKL